jgi:serine protease AprX
VFARNYPHAPKNTSLLSVPERTGAPPHFSGRGVTMAFVDSGFYPHPDIADRIVLFVDASSSRITEGALPASNNPLNWHGQMTSVIAAGDGRTSDGRYRGIASSAQLVLIKVSNRRKQIKEADILRGLTWLVKHAHKHNIRVVNVSVGGDHPNPDPQHPLHVALRQLCEQGVVVLIATGNSNQPVLLPPASASTAITIGGYDDGNTGDGTKWRIFGGSYGTGDDGAAKPEVIAPAAWLASPIMPGTDMAREAPWLVQMLALKKSETAAFQKLAREADTVFGFSKHLKQHPTAHLKDLVQERIFKHKIVDAHHQHVDGTSVSVAVASSIVAAMLEAQPSLSPAQVKARLMQTATPLPNVPHERQGAGMIDAAAAISS